MPVRKRFSQESGVSSQSKAVVPQGFPSIHPRCWETPQAGEQARFRAAAQGCAAIGVVSRKTVRSFSGLAVFFFPHRQLGLKPAAFAAQRLAAGQLSQLGFWQADCGTQVHHGLVKIARAVGGHDGRQRIADVLACPRVRTLSPQEVSRAAIRSTLPSTAGTALLKAMGVSRPPV